MIEIEDTERSEIAKKLFDAGECGELYLSWISDEYWGLVVKNTILPKALKIHDELVTNKITEDVKLSFNDCDDDIFYIPTTDNKKVFVHTTQNLDYIFIIDSGEYHLNFHVRRIYRSFNSKYSLKAKDLVGSMKKALSNVDSLSELNDDHNEYLRRPSLKYYRKKNFTVQYGDFRDPGYVLSYKPFISMMSENNSDTKYPPRIEGSIISYRDLKYVEMIQDSALITLDEISVKTP